MKKTSYITLASTIAMAAVATVAYAAGSGTKSANPEMGQIGDPAPMLEIASWVKGQPVDLAEGQGKKAYLVEFWATWCPQCEKVIPHLSEIQKEYGDSGLSVVAVSMEEKEVVENFVKSKGAAMDYTIGLDKDQQTAMAYMAKFGLNGIPASFLVDKQGKIAWVGHPADPELETQLAKLFPNAEKSEAGDSATKPAPAKKRRTLGGSGSK
tara:strand:- start:14 stop:643 length:630 start_codon:yes stop_codon:yes gene_type:complete